MAATTYERFGLPNCLGFIDGKHVQVTRPPNSGSTYFDYKRTFSTVLLAIVSADYQVLYADFGSSVWDQNDAAIWGSSGTKRPHFMVVHTEGKIPSNLTIPDFNRELKAGGLHLPLSSFLPDSNTLCPYFFVGDGIFPLEEYLLKPFGGHDLTDEQRYYNYK